MERAATAMNDNYFLTADLRGYPRMNNFMDNNVSRRQFVLGAGAAAAAAFVPRVLQASASAPPIAMTVYKSPLCGCCKEWVKHVEANGFAVKVVDLDYEVLDAKRLQLGVPTELASCHTGVVGGYLIEGHVPADLVKKLLAEKPRLLGLAVPGMIVGSPGMEQGSTKQPYSVVAFTKDRKTSVYARR